MAARHCDGTSPTCPLASRSALARGFSREGAKSTGHGRPNSARPLGQVNSCRSQPVDGPLPLSCGSSWASQSGPRLTLWLGPCAHHPEDTQSLWTARSPGPTALFPRRLQRALPRGHFPHRHQGWQMCTASQLHDPGRSCARGTGSA